MAVVVSGSAPGFRETVPDPTSEGRLKASLAVAELVALDANKERSWGLLPRVDAMIGRVLSKTRVMAV
jgi:hypothetical protein